MTTVDSAIGGGKLVVTQAPQTIVIVQNSTTSVSGSFVIDNMDLLHRDVLAQASVTANPDLSGRISVGDANNNVSLPWDVEQTVGFTVNTANLGVGTYTAQILLKDRKVPSNAVPVTITVIVVPPAYPTFDLGVKASESTTQVQSGQTVTYTFTYTNAGPDDSTEADMTATIPGDLSVNSVTSTNGQAAQITAGSIQDVGPLPAGGTVTVTVQCTANSTSQTENAAITARISPFNFAVGNDYNPGNNSSNVSTTITGGSTTSGPSFTVSPQGLDLTDSYPSFSSIGSFKITNTGTTKLTLQFNAQAGSSTRTSITTTESRSTRGKARRFRRRRRLSRKPGRTRQIS